VVHVDRVVHLDVGRDNPAALGVEVLGRQLGPARVAGAEHHQVAERGQLPADLQADTVAGPGDHGD
jgi:hypothetical protein